MDQNEFNVTETASSLTVNDTQYDGFDMPPEEDKGIRFAHKLRAIFSSKAFLVATIAYTVMAGIALISSGIDLFAILFTIGMWTVYAAAKKETPLKEMKFLSGVLKAYYILTIIGIVFLVIAAVILIAFAPMVMDLGPEIDNAFNEIENGSYVNSFMEIDEETLEIMGDMHELVYETLHMTYAAFFGVAMIVFGVVFIISAIISVIINELFVHKLMKQFKIANDAASAHTDAELKLGGIRVWFILLGVFTSISALPMLASPNLFLALVEVAHAIAYFALASATRVEPTDEISSVATSSDAQPML